MGTVYGLHGDDEVIRYIGITVGPLKRRLNQHKAMARTGQLPLHIWIRATTNVQITALEEHDDQELLWGAEHRLILEHRLTDTGLLNVTDGGDGSPGYKHTAEAKARISAKRKGWVPTEEQRARMGESHRGYVMPEEHKRNIAEGNKGRVFTPETRAKISEGLKAAHARNPRTVPEETRAKISASVKAARAAHRAS